MPSTSRKLCATHEYTPLSGARSARNKALNNMTHK